MVYVAQSHSHLIHDANPDWQAWLTSIAEGRREEELVLLHRSLAFAEAFYAGKSVAGGVGLMQHTLGTAAIVASMHLDHEAIAAAVLHAVPDCDATGLARIVEAFGPAVAQLVDGVARMGQIREYPTADDASAGKGEQMEGLRKMLLAMVEDIRVVLIKLAKRTQTMRALVLVDEKTRHDMARETQDIFAPLASRLGVWQIKWELEDLSFRYLEPELYKKIAQLLDERRVDRERYIQEVLSQLKDELARNGVHAEVNGRPKHIYSIYRKMKRKKVDFSEVYDVRAVRVLVEDLKDCYTALGVVHSIWQPIPGEFDDYIAHPKGNFYRSLHTAVIGPEDKALEVQIRTDEMHQHAEMGVAAHWRYKEGGKQDARFGKKIAWLRQILEWKEDIHDAGDLMERFKTELFHDTVYVLTPQGKVVSLTAEATPLDFAYHIHTDLGHRCRGAKVDGNIMPLNHRLQNGQRVEILAAKEGGPSRDWLNPVLGYIKSPRARAKIRHWFKYQHYQEDAGRGREMLEREAHRLGVELPPLDKLARTFSFTRPEDFLAALGRGNVTLRQIAVLLREPGEVRGPSTAPQRAAAPRHSGG
ncbi:MAG TPA: GTP pyrophosphokinase, partial [Betaproteobacteria bacterium]|nr:GTP pyrophosphokinase [Betaproteobacteria bacterium]